MKQSSTKKLGLVMLVLLSILLVGCGKDSSLCAVGDCPNNHIENVKYCISHKCLEVGCTELRTGKGYCEEHFSCIKCGNERNEGSEYCFIHGCSKTGCPEPKIVGAGYCTKHIDGYTCLVPDCKTQIPDFAEYCEEHICKSCNKQRMDGQQYCQIHYQNIKEEEKQKQKEQEQIQNQKVVEKDALLIDSNGKQLWRVCTIGNEFRFKANYRGTGNYIVTMMDSNQDYYAMICNEIGDYVVDKRIPVYGGEFYYIEIYCSDGSWSGSWSGTYGS